MTERKISGVAHALSRAGAAATQHLADALAVEGLAPAHLGVLRSVAQQPGLSQQDLAAALGIAPSRVVALVDDLEDKGLVERRRSTRDRRVSELHTPQSARAQLARVRTIVRDHDAWVTAALTSSEIDQLLTLLGNIARDPTDS